MNMIFFDFFDVLSTPAYEAVIKKNIPENEQAEWIAMLDQLDLGELHEDELVRRLSKRIGIPEFQVWKEIEEGPQLNTRMFEYIEKEIKPQCKVGLLTNAPRSLIERALQKELPLFDVVVISSDFGVIKPDPRIFEIALTLSNTKPEETIFIDDKERNTSAAQSLGIQGIVYRGVPQLKTELQKHLS